MPSLYRKYRPQRFDEISGQNHIKITLQNEISTGNISHAYLFCGPRGTGKTTIARLFAKSVNCVNRKSNEYEPCNQCESCKEIMEGRSIDVMEIDAASNTGVDNVRENIINSSRFMPTKRKYKVFIIDEVHMLSASAFNALLKILEEPPAHVIFILATTEIHKIIATIISRCQRFDFKKINYKDLSEKLRRITEAEHIHVESKVLDLVASHSDGCLRDAESLLGQILSLGDSQITLQQAEIVMPVTNYNLPNDFLELLVQKDIANAIKFVNNLVEDGINIEQFNKDLIEYLRKMLLYKISGTLDDFSVEMDESLEKKLIALSQHLNLTEIINYIDKFIQASIDLKNTVILQLPLELAVIQLAQDSEERSGRAERKTNDECRMSPSEADALWAQNSELQIKLDAGCMAQDAGRKTQDAGRIMQNAERKTQNVERKPSKQEKTIIDDKTLLLWDNVKLYIKPRNYSLYCALTTAKALSFKDEIFTIGFKHKFNLEKVSELKNKKLLQEAFETENKNKVSVEFVIDENIEIIKDSSNSISYESILAPKKAGNNIEEKNHNMEENKKEKDPIQNVLDVFGGEVLK